MDQRLKDLSDLALFVNVVEIGGIASCARHLGYERTTVSRRLGRLEIKLGVSLLNRTTKQVTVTDAGRRCFEQCSFILEAAEMAKIAAVSGESGDRLGPIVFGAPPAVYDVFLHEYLSQFQTNSNLTDIEFVPMSLWSGEAFDSVDMGLALAPVRLTQAWSKRLTVVEEVVCASPAFLEATGEVGNLEQLEHRHCISDESTTSPNVWRFGRHGDFKDVQVNIVHSTSSPLEAREAAIAGLGMCCLPLFMCEPYLKGGQLVRILPSCRPAGRGLDLVTSKKSSRRQQCTELRIYLEGVFSNAKI